MILLLLYHFVCFPCNSQHPKSYLYEKLISGVCLMQMLSDGLFNQPNCFPVSSYTFVVWKSLHTYLGLIVNSVQALIELWLGKREETIIVLRTSCGFQGRLGLDPWFEKNVNLVVFSVVIHNLCKVSVLFTGNYKT